MIKYERGLYLTPTGADFTYRRSDYVRGALFSLASGAVAIAAWLGLSLLDWPAPAFVVVLLAALAISAAVILTAQALLGSVQPVGFAVDPRFVPLGVRQTIRVILAELWNPLNLAPGSDFSPYEPYVAPLYHVATRVKLAEAVARELETIEQGELRVEVEPPQRFRAAEAIVEAVSLQS